MSDKRKPGRVVRVEIVIDAEDPAGDEDLNRCLRALGAMMCDRGHENIMRAELLAPSAGNEERKEITKQADPSLN